VTNRPANPPVIHQSDMQAGDVILSAGSTVAGDDAFLDKAILALDQGNYTHSSLWDGSHVIEALKDGVQTNDPLSLTLTNQVLVDVYRFDKDNEHFGAVGYPVDPLLEAARAFRGYAYGYSKLVLAGLLLLTCEIPKEGALRVVLKLIEMPILREMEKWLKADHSMVCSEVVAQAFWDARTNPANHYGLPSALDGHRRFPTLAAHQNSLQSVMQDPDASPELVAIHRLKADLAGLFEAHPAKSLAKTAPPVAVTLIAGSAELPAMFVTPGDLQRSSALSLVGTLKQPDGGQ